MGAGPRTAGSGLYTGSKASDLDGVAEALGLLRATGSVAAGRPAVRDGRRVETKAAGERFLTALR
jgi:hypothetical protein